MVQDYNDLTSKIVEGVYQLTLSSLQLILRILVCVVIDENILSVSDLSRIIDKYDVTLLITAKGLSTMSLQECTVDQLCHFADFLHAHCRQLYISAVPVIC